jgi:hypothetical protein
MLRGEVERRIEEMRSEGTTTLDLGEIDLTELPESFAQRPPWGIASLTQLKALRTVTL